MTTVATSGLDVYAHNIETVEALQRFVRDRRANYAQSLSVLKHVKDNFPHIVSRQTVISVEAEVCTNEMSMHPLS